MIFEDKFMSTRENRRTKHVVTRLKITNECVNSLPLRWSEMKNGEKPACAKRKYLLLEGEGNGISLLFWGSRSRYPLGET